MCYLVPQTPDSSDLPVIYKVQRESGNEALSQAIGDVILPRTIRPGGFVTFVVQRQHLVKGYSVFVEINYSWEIRDQIAPYGVEPNHRVYFSHGQLPADQR